MCSVIQENTVRLSNQKLLRRQFACARGWLNHVESVSDLCPMLLEQLEICGEDHDQIVCVDQDAFCETCAKVDLENICDVACRDFAIAEGPPIGRGVEEGVSFFLEQG